jgi:uncharacterized protein DUF4154
MERKHWSLKFIWRVLYFLSVFLIFIGFITSSAKANEIKIENKIKAAFLINFMLYVGNEEKTNNERYLCLYSKKKFGDFIHHVLEEKNKKFGDLNISINYIGPDKPAGYCHAVFVSSDDTQSINLKEFSKDILTIGEVPDFLPSGGMINFFIEDDRVYFAVNIDAINGSNTMLSSQLLKLARTSKK